MSPTRAPRLSPVCSKDPSVLFKIRLSAPKLQNLMRNERASMRSADILGGVPFSVGAAPPLVNAWQLAGWYDPRFPRLVSPSCQKVARSWQCNGYLADAKSGQPILLQSSQLLTTYRFEPWIILASRDGDVRDGYRYLRNITGRARKQRDCDPYSVLLIAKSKQDPFASKLLSWCGAVQTHPLTQTNTSCRRTKYMDYPVQAGEREKKNMMALAKWPWPDFRTSASHHLLPTRTSMYITRIPWSVFASGSWNRRSACMRSSVFSHTSKHASGEKKQLC